MTRKLTLALLTLALAAGASQAGTCTGERYVVIGYNGILKKYKASTGKYLGTVHYFPTYTKIGDTTLEQLHNTITVEYGEGASGSYKFPVSASDSTLKYRINFGAMAVPESAWKEQKGWQWNSFLGDTGDPEVSVPSSSPCAGVAAKVEEADGAKTSVSLLMTGSCPRCASGSSAENGSINLSIDAGTMGPGTAKGSASVLKIYQHSPTPDLGNPSTLAYNFNNPKIIKILDPAHPTWLRQVKTPGGLIDVVVTDTNSYDVVRYPTTSVGAKVGSFYTITGAPTARTSITAQDGGNVLLVQETQYDVTGTPQPNAKTWRYSWSSSDNGFFLAYGYDAGSGSALKTTLRGEAFPDSSTLVVTEKTLNPDGNEARRTVSTFKNINADDTTLDRWLEISRVEGTGSATETTATTYYDSWPADGTKYHYVKSTTDPRGVVTAYEYDSSGRKTKETRTYPDGVPTRITDYTYPASTTVFNAFAPLTEVITEGGATVSSTSWTYSPTQTTVTRTDGTSSLTTTTKYNSDGLVASEVRPDGTATRYSYITSGNNFITSVSVGAGTESSVTSGIQTVTVQDTRNGRQLSTTVYDIASTQKISQEQNTTFDSEDRVLLTTYLDGTTHQYIYGCCGLLQEIDRDGIVTTYERDQLNRVTAVTRDGIRTESVYDGLDRVVKTTQVGRDSSPIVTQETTYDALGRATSVKAPSPTGSGTANTTTTYSANGLTRTTTLPDNSTRVETSDSAGRTVSVSGTSVHPVTYQYGNDANGQFTREISGSESTTTNTNALGQTTRITYADGSATTMDYNAKGQLVKTTDADNVSVLYAYDAEGRQSTVATDRNGNGQIDAADTVREATKQWLQSHGTLVEKSTTTENGAVISIAERSSDGLRTWTTNYGLESSSITTRQGGGAATTTLTRPDGSTTVANTQNGRETTRTIKDGAGTTLTTTATTYDGHNRVLTVAETGVGTTTNTYIPAGQLASTTTPAPGSGGGSAQTTIYAYDALGRLVTTTLPDTSVTTNEYHPTGELKKTSGSQTYTAEYTYDSHGRQATLTTQGQAGSEVTAWTYNSRGLLTTKTYPDNKSVTYTYKPGGRLLARTWARNVTTTYGYSPAGDLASVSYSDGTPGATYSYDARGRRTGITDGAGTRTLAFTNDGQPQSESWSGGVLDTVVSSNSYNPLLLRSGMDASVGGGSIAASTLTYDTASRLAEVAQGNLKATTTYTAPLQTVGSIAFQKAGATVLTSTQTRDNLRRITAIVNTAGNATASSHTYTYDALNKRTAAARHDGTQWVYGYDALGQVISARKSSGSNPVPGQQFEYDYDGIGNRVQAREGGDLTGGNLRLWDYTSNSNNQYTQRTVPSVVDVAGHADPVATVTVEAQGSVFPTNRNAGFFHKALTYANTTAPVFDTANVVGVITGAGPGGTDIVTEEPRDIVRAKTPEAFSYDDDGNLTQDGLWSYTWDGENRLTAMQSLSTVPDDKKLRLEFGYDSNGRRVSKSVSKWNAGAYVPDHKSVFIWNGWLPVAEVTGPSAATGTVKQTFTWGNDLSGSLEGAGGVSGLLWINDIAGDESHLVGYDASGNVAATVAAATGTVSARYDYGPFGQVLEASGVFAENNPFRFSTKYADVETGLLYYGYRFYNPVTGRWLSRDPIEEDGGANLYGFVGNDPNNMFDSFGHAKFQAMLGEGLVFRGTVEITHKRTQDCCDVVKVSAEIEAGLGAGIGVQLGKAVNISIGVMLIGVGQSQSVEFKICDNGQWSLKDDKQIANVSKFLTQALYVGGPSTQIYGGVKIGYDLEASINRIVTVERHSASLELHAKGFYKVTAAAALKLWKISLGQSSPNDENEILAKGGFDRTISSTSIKY